MKKIVILAMIAVLVCACQSQKQSKLKVGIVQFGDYPSLIDAAKGLKEGLEAYDIVETNAHGQPDNLPIQLASLVDKKVDVIVALTTQGAQMAQNVLEGTNIPFIFLAVSDPKGAGLEGVAGVSDLAPIDQQLKLVKDLLPDAQRIGMVYRLSDANGEYQHRMYQQASTQHGLEMISKGVMDTQDLSLVLPGLVDQVDAMFLITDDLNVTSTSMIVDVASKKSVPVFASEDGQFDQGVFASVSISYIGLGKQAADMVRKILDGEVVEGHEMPKELTVRISKTISDNLEIVIPVEMKDFMK